MQLNKLINILKEKNILLINRRIGRSNGESQGTLLNKVETFKGILRNEVNKENIERGRTKKNQKGKSHNSSQQAGNL